MAVIYFPHESISSNFTKSSISSILFLALLITNISHMYAD